MPRVLDDEDDELDELPLFQPSAAMSIRGGRPAKWRDAGIHSAGGGLPTTGFRSTGNLDCAWPHAGNFLISLSIIQLGLAEAD
jgi:hypothetical protein